MKTRLFINHYSPPDATRCAELDEALRRNLANPHIDSVTVLAQSPPERRGEFDCPKVIWHKLPGQKRPTYRQYFELVNQQVDHPQDLSIVCNSDIFFDETIGLLKCQDLEHVCCALTRWEWHADRPPDFGAGDMMKLIRISDGDQRGSGEGDDGWREIDRP